MVKIKRKNISLDYREMSPIAFLEGGLGLNDEESKLAKMLSDSWGLTSVFCIDDLYQNPRKLASVSFLDIKTLVIGTTGIYEDSLNMLLEFYKTLNITTVRNIIFAISADEFFQKEAKNLKEQFPDFKFFKLIWADDEEYKIHEIEL
jgi:hypothetical protein